MSIDNPSIVECEEDIHWIYENQPRPVITCAYCGAKTRMRDVEKALRWWLDHEYLKKSAPEYE